MDGKHNNTRLDTNDMTNRELVDLYLENQTIQTCVSCQFAQLKGIDKQNREDFQQDLIVTLLSYDNDKMNDAHNNNHFNALVTAICIRNLWSKTSPYYKTYKKFLDRATEEITDEIKDTLPDGE